MFRQYNFALFLLIIAGISCRTLSTKPTTVTEESLSPSTSDQSGDNFTYSEPTWAIGESDFFSAFNTEITVVNNSSKPLLIVFSFELYKSDGTKLADCSTGNIFNSMTNNIISSNRTARLECSASTNEAIDEAEISTYKFLYKLESATFLDEKNADGTDVVETGIQTDYESTDGNISYSAYARIQSKSDQLVTVRYYILDDQGVQIAFCQSYEELRHDLPIRTNCKDPIPSYKITDDPKHIPASVLINIIK